MKNVLMTSFISKRLSAREPDIHWLPHSAGCLISYAKKNSFVNSNYNFFTPIYIPNDYENYINILTKTDILCLTNYVWNQKYNDGFAKLYKTIRPDGFVIYGGASVPEHKDYSQQYAEARPYVDLFFVGPGEMTLTNFLINYNNPIDSHHGSFGITFNNVVVDKSTYLIPADQIPNPYLDGIFDPIIKSIDKKKIGITFETTRGCPFRCSFCDWGGLSRSLVSKLNLDSVMQTVEWIYQHGDKIAIVDIIDANLGMTRRDLDVLQYFEKCQTDTGHKVRVTVNGFVKNGSPYLKDTILTLNRITSYSKNVMLSFQTHSEEALKTIDRDNIRNEKLYPLIKELQNEGLDIKSEMILGLPGETLSSYVKSLETDFNLGVTSMRSYPLIFIVNTPMYATEYRIKHGLKTKKILLPYDLFVNKDQYLENVNLQTSCDFVDDSLYEEIEILYECNSFTNNELIEILKRWWWYHNFYNLGTIKDEIIRLNNDGVSITAQIQLFFDMVNNGDLPIIKKILDIYQQAITDVYCSEPISKLTNVNAVHFFQKGMRTYEPAYFIDNKDAVKSELEKIYGTVNTSHWLNRSAVMLDNTI
jgi:radical SAM superfamily enzyme YgiQ (UPF0313 family)